jgi:hypothetical protein
MTVQITLKSTQHTGMATSTEGSVAAWQVTFELDEDDSLHAAINIRLAGPATHHEARQKNTNFQIRTFPTAQHRIKPAHVGLWLGHYDATNGLHSLNGYSLHVSRVAIKSVGYAARRIGTRL